MGNLTLTDANEVPGIEGVLQAYSQCVSKVQLYGPTYFHEIIQTAASSAASMTNDNESEQNYFILLIITDGIINDMKQTIDAIVGATELPLSIIIVGVGDADFSAMDKLDADDVPLKASNGKVMKRDIVQFVPFNQFQNQHISALAKEVLEEVPGQITGFMTMKKLHPLRNKGAMSKQPTMNNLYDGPSTLVNQQTQKNLYPDVKANAPQNQPVNPYYAQGQAQPQAAYAQPGQGAPPQYGHQQNGSIYAQQQAVQQQAYNPHYGNAANAPSAPTF